MVEIKLFNTPFLPLYIATYTFRMSGLDLMRDPGETLGDVAVADERVWTREHL